MHEYQQCLHLEPTELMTAIGNWIYEPIRNTTCLHQVLKRPYRA